MARRSRVIAPFAAAALAFGTPTLIPQVAAVADPGGPRVERTPPFDFAHLCTVIGPEALLSSCGPIPPFSWADVSGRMWARGIAMGPRQGCAPTASCRSGIFSGAHVGVDLTIPAGARVDAEARIEVRLARKVDACLILGGWPVSARSCATVEEDPPLETEPLVITASISAPHDRTLQVSPYVLLYAPGRAPDRCAASTCVTIGEATLQVQSISYVVSYP